MALPFKETCLYLSSTSEHGSLPVSISPATRSVALVHPLGPLLGYTIVCAPLGPCHTPPRVATPGARQSAELKQRFLSAVFFPL